MAILVAAIVMVLGAWNANAQSVLIVTAHPDDEGACAAMTYRITKELGGSADLVVITNGEAGYKYSVLAEAVYGKPLTIEDTARRYLPEIRKRELIAASKWIGIRNIYFLDNKDTQYTLDADSVLKYVWNVDDIRRRLAERMTAQQYDFIITILPTDDTHGHHKATAILTLETFEMLIKTRRFPGKEVPTILGMGTGDPESIKKFKGMKTYPITAIDPSAPVYVFDRTQAFGYGNQLDYTVIVKWHAAEHKSQGLLHMRAIREQELYMLFNINRGSAKSRAKWLFQRVKR